jgi:uncharacterized protein YbaP (TraB family)
VKKTNLLFALLVAFASAETIAQSTTYYEATGIVEIPCVYASDFSQVIGVLEPYQVRLRRIGATEQFALEQIQPTAHIEDCRGYFDTSTDLYTDFVDIGEYAYQVQLRRSADNIFTLQAYALRGPASTSLWKVTKGANTVYIGGTVDRLRAPDYPLPKAFDEAYAKSSVLYFELDLDNPEETGENLTPDQLRQLAWDPERERVRQVLSADTWSALDLFMQQRGAWLIGVDDWSVQAIVDAMLTLETVEAWNFAAKGVAAHFAAKAKADRKTVHGLETALFQRNLLQTLNEGAEEQLAIAMLQDIATDTARKNLVERVDQWRLGDMTGLNSSYITGFRAENPRDYQLMLTNRTAAWLTQVEAMLDTPETELVLVDVAHLAGDEGLIRLLNRRYRVEKY